MLARNNVTHVYCLGSGDRFYFVSDAKRVVWQVIYHTNIWFRGNKLAGAMCGTDNGGRKRFLSKRVVVYLPAQKRITVSKQIEIQ